MPRIAPLDPARATGRAKELLDGVQASLGATPNLLRTLAHSPAALEAYLAFSKALSGGLLSEALQEQIALAIAGENHCDYCASAHTLIAKGAGVPDQEAAENLAGRSADPRTRAILDFARAIVASRGFVSDAQLDAVREAGVGDGEIAEIIAAVAKNIYTNYFNHVARTDIDFPRVSAGEAEAATAA
ncbi:MAG: carboxymuconolactone decarboxylase family protein [Methyloligellaceae bacterium]